MSSTSEMKEHRRKEKEMEQPKTKKQKMKDKISPHIDSLMQDSLSKTFYEMEPTATPEAVRLFVAWWLKYCMFVKRPLMNPHKLKQMLDNNEKVIIIDARRPDEYKESHIKNAINISSFANSFPELEGVDSNCPIVVYCAVGMRSGWLARKLSKKEARNSKEGGRTFPNAMALQGGFYGWVNSGLPIYKKECGCEMRQSNPHPSGSSGAPAEENHKHKQKEEEMEHDCASPNYVQTYLVKPQHYLASWTLKKGVKTKSDRLWWFF